MTLMAAFVLAFLSGLSIAAASGYFIQWWSGVNAGFRPPFVTPHHMARSLAVTLAAGPFLLTREAIAAWRDRDIPRGLLGLCALVVPLWMTATGIVVLSLSERVFDLVRTMAA